MKKTEDIKTFLNLISAIPSNFIEDFFKFYKEETLQTDFVIDLEQVAKWLQCRKADLLKTLRTSYKHNIDYVITRVKPRIKYGNNLLQCMITPDCFKRLCMLSRSKNAEQVRSYFIELESLIIKYRTQLIQGIKQDIARIEKQKKMKKSIENNSGYTYIIKASTKHKDMFKVGYSKTLIDRLRTYQTGKYEDIELVFLYKTENPEAVEKCVKSLAYKHKLDSNREIYHLDLDVLKSIMNGCGKLSMKLEKRVSGSSKIDGQYYMILDKQFSTDINAPSLQP
jgi:phage anti-repressor protein